MNRPRFRAAAATRRAGSSGRRFFWPPTREPPTNQIAATVRVGGSTIYRTRRRFVEANLDGAVDAIRAGKLVPVLEAYERPATPIRLIHVARAQMPLRMRRFLDFAATALRKSLAAIGSGF
jgi:hypothetical protein